MWFGIAQVFRFYCDRGVQYAAVAFREQLESYGIRQNTSRKGTPYDNAVAENFFSCLKYELIHLKHYPTRASAQADVFAYMETFYNTVRPHSALSWLSPTQFEARLLPPQAAGTSIPQKSKDSFCFLSTFVSVFSARAHST